MYFNWLFENNAPLKFTIHRSIKISELETENICSCVQTNENDHQYTM